MQRWLSPLLGVAALSLAAVVVLRAMDGKAPEPTSKAPATDAATRDAAKPDAGVSLPDAASVPSTTMSDPTAGVAHFADGRPVPPLPDGAPKQVRLGVVLVSFAGAEGAARNARDKKDALAIATRLAADAKTDFHGAVARGDSGSSDDIGRIPRRTLEAPTEYLLFTMAVGSVSDPIETPRGYWVAKRTE